MPKAVDEFELIRRYFMRQAMSSDVTTGIGDDGAVLRHMRPTLSELGEYDGTALMEFKTKKNVVYLLHKSNVCTYEMDDTPPFPPPPAERHRRMVLACGGTDGR